MGDDVYDLDGYEALGALRAGKHVQCNRNECVFTDIRVSSDGGYTVHDLTHESWKELAHCFNLTASEKCWRVVEPTATVEFTAREVELIRKRIAPIGYDEAAFTQDYRTSQAVLGKLKGVLASDYGEAGE